MLLEKFSSTVPGNKLFLEKNQTLLLSVLTQISYSVWLTEVQLHYPTVLITRQKENQDFSYTFASL